MKPFQKSKNKQLIANEERPDDVADLSDDPSNQFHSCIIQIEDGKDHEDPKLLPKVNGSYGNSVEDNESDSDYNKIDKACGIISLQNSGSFDYEEVNASSIVEDIASKDDFEHSSNIEKKINKDETETNEDHDLGFIVVFPPNSKTEMVIHEEARQDFFLDDQIIQCSGISKSPYRFFLMFSGLISSRFAPPHSIRYFLQKVLIFVFILCFLLLKFDALFDLNFLIIEKKFPFTVANNIIWELRWIFTYVLTKHFMSKNGFKDFLQSIRITRLNWRQNGKTMKWYIVIVFIITVLVPCVFVVFDLNFLNVDKIKADRTSFAVNIIFTIIVFLYRMIVVPCFCLLSVMLYLLGDHVRQVGKEIYTQKSCKDVHNLVQNMRKLIRSTEKSLQIIIMVHMFLIFCTSFTTAMSTLERLEFKYTTKKGNNNQTSTSLEVHIADIQPNNVPVTDFVNLKMDFNQMQKHFALLNTKPNEEETNGFRRENLKTAYELISKVHQKQIQLLETMIENNNKPRNISVQSRQQSDPSKFYNIVLSIEDSYTKLRVVLDSVMSLIEILLLYMSPLILIIRTDYILRDTVGDVWDINIDEQKENNLAITSYGAKEHVLDHVKDTEGFRVCGYKVDFFKTLILASFGPFFAIALRATWKHFGLF